jgi:hypothetical protein
MYCELIFIKAAVLYKHHSTVPRVFYCHFTSVIVCFVIIFLSRSLTITKGYQNYAPHTYKRYFLLKYVL